MPNVHVIFYSVARRPKIHRAVFETVPPECIPYSFPLRINQLSAPCRGVAIGYSLRERPPMPADINDGILPLAELVRLRTAHDLGPPGYDIEYGNGLLDVYAAARALAPEAWEGGRRRPGR